MTDFLHWFMFWKQPKNLPQAVFQGFLGGFVFLLVVFLPLWVELLVTSHG